MGLGIRIREVVKRHVAQEVQHDRTLVVCQLSKRGTHLSIGNNRTLSAGRAFANHLAIG